MTLLTGFLLVVIVALIVAGLYFFGMWQIASNRHGVLGNAVGAPVISPALRQTLAESSPALATFRDQISIEGGLS